MFSAADAAAAASAATVASLKKTDTLLLLMLPSVIDHEAGRPPLRSHAAIASWLLGAELRHRLLP